MSGHLDVLGEQLLAYSTGNPFMLLVHGGFTGLDAANPNFDPLRRALIADLEPFSGRARGSGSTHLEAAAPRSSPGP